MATLEDIKNEYAKENWKQDWADLASWITPTELEFDEIAKRYAKAKLEEAAERATVEVEGYFNHEMVVNKDSIINTPLD